MGVLRPSTVVALLAGAYLGGGSRALAEEVVVMSRYIVEALPAQVGVVVPLDQAIVESLCRDKDGCEVVIAMLNFDLDSPVQIGTTSPARLFLSATSGHWRFSGPDGYFGLDDNGVNDEVIFNDCYFGDAENPGGAANSRTDADPGFGLLNVLGGFYSDVTTICRVLLMD